MGACGCVNSGASFESQMDDFYDNMLLRKTSHDSIIKEIKKRWTKGLKEEKFKDIVDSYLGKSLDNIADEHYIGFWTNIYKQINEDNHRKKNDSLSTTADLSVPDTQDIRYLIYSILILCEKNTVKTKQEIKNLACSNLFKQQDVFYSNLNTSNSASICREYAKKSFLKKILFEYITLITSKTIKYATPFKSDETSIKLGYLDLFNDKNIKNFCDYLIADLDKTCKSKIAINNNNNPLDFKSEEIYSDFDEFFDYLYSEYLHNDAKTRKKFLKFIEKK